MEEFDLSYFVKTKSEAVDFSTRIGVISEKIYSTDFNFEAVLSEQFGIQKKDKFLELLRENNMDIGTTTALKDFMEKLQKKISTLPVVSFTLAFEPRDETLAAISEWFVVNIKKQTVIDIKVDTSIVAGASIFYEGKFKDYSIRSRLDAIIKSATETLNSSPAPALHQSTELISLGR